MSRSYAPVIHLKMTKGQAVTYVMLEGANLKKLPQAHKVHNEFGSSPLNTFQALNIVPRGTTPEAATKLKITPDQGKVQGFGDIYRCIKIYSALNQTQFSIVLFDNIVYMSIPIKF